MRCCRKRSARSAASPAADRTPKRSLLAARRSTSARRAVPTASASSLRCSACTPSSQSGSRHRAAVARRADRRSAVHRLHAVHPGLSGRRHHRRYQAHAHGAAAGVYRLRPVRGALPDGLHRHGRGGAARPWTNDDAAIARERLHRRTARLAQDKLDNEQRLAAKAVAKLRELDARDDLTREQVDQKKAVVQAAMERARARRTAAATPPGANP
jgi:hypothetical protein